VNFGKKGKLLIKKMYQLKGYYKHEAKIMPFRAFAVFNQSAFMKSPTVSWSQWMQKQS